MSLLWQLLEAGGGLSCLVVLDSLIRLLWFLYSFQLVQVMIVTMFLIRTSLCGITGGGTRLLISQRRDSQEMGCRLSHHSNCCNSRPNCFGS